MTFNLFNLFNKQENCKKIDEIIIVNKTNLLNNIKEKYYIDCSWSGSYWYITLYQKIDGREHDQSIKFASAESDKDRDRIINDYKINKDKYIQDYKNKTSQNMQIPL